MGFHRDLVLRRWAVIIRFSYAVDSPFPSQTRTYFVDAYDAESATARIVSYFEQEGFHVHKAEAHYG